jgi:hypothetical protein
MAKASKYPTPNLTNMTDMGLVDCLAEARAKEADAKFYAGFYGDALKGRLRATNNLINGYSLKGQKYVACVTVSDVERFDITAAREAAKTDPQVEKFIKRFLKVTTTTTVRTYTLEDDEVDTL